MRAGIFIVTGAVLWVSACGNKVPNMLPLPTNTPAATPTPIGPPPAGGSYRPLRVGNVWTYDVEQGGILDTTTLTVMSTASTIGVDAYCSKPGPFDGTIYEISIHKAGSTCVNCYRTYLEEDRGIVVLRHEERAFDAAAAMKSEDCYMPSKVSLDMQPANLVANRQYFEKYDETEWASTTGVIAKTDIVSWTVLPPETVITPAGTFVDCLTLDRLTQDPAGYVRSHKKQWWYQGVGKVKEYQYDDGQTETLVSYHLAP